MRTNTKKAISVLEMAEYTLVHVGLNGHSFLYKSNQRLQLKRVIFKSRTR